MKKILGALAALLLTAQAAPNITGQECWNAGQGSGGPSAGYLCTFMVQNSQGVLTTALTAPMTMSQSASDIIITAQPAAAANITLPPSPLNGQIVEVVNGTTAAFATNVFSIVPSGSQTIVGGNIALTTLAAGASKELRYVQATNTWYPLR